MILDVVQILRKSNLFLAEQITPFAMVLGLPAGIVVLMGRNWRGSITFAGVVACQLPAFLMARNFTDIQRYQALMVVVASLGWVLLMAETLRLIPRAFGRTVVLLVAGSAVGWTWYHSASITLAPSDEVQEYHFLQNHLPNLVKPALVISLRDVPHKIWSYIPLHLIHEAGYGIRTMTLAQAVRPGALDQYLRHYHVYIFRGTNWYVVEHPTPVLYGEEPRPLPEVVQKWQHLRDALPLREIAHAEVLEHPTAFPGSRISHTFRPGVGRSFPIVLLEADPGIDSWSGEKPSSEIEDDDEAATPAQLHDPTRP